MGTRAIEHFRHSGTRRAIGHPGHLGTRALEKGHLGTQELGHVGNPGTLFSRLLQGKCVISNSHREVTCICKP